MRLRPGLIFKRAAATEIRRLFLGPFVPRWVFRSSLLPLIPDVPRLATQAVHSDDVAEAYRLAALGNARGAFNIAADPVIDVRLLAQLVGARTVPVPAPLLRAGAAAAFALRLTPVEPGWLDLALGVPTMSTERAKQELGFSPTRTADEALRELFLGLRDGAAGSTPTLAREASGPGRLREFLTGLGARQ